MIKPLTHQTKLRLVIYRFDFLHPLCWAVAVLSPAGQGGREKTLDGRAAAGDGGMEEL